MAAARYDMEKGGRYGEGKYPPPASTQHEPYPQQREDRERQWVPWAVPLVVAANIVLFAVTMYANNCPAHAAGSRRHRGGGACVAGFLNRFSLQPLSENPLLGPSSAT
jgi:hypothetical protein